MTLTEFITARLDEDERRALEASPGAPVWRARLYDGAWQVVDHEGDVVVLAPELDTVNAHIARHDPARVLREVEAKRALLVQFPPMGNSYGTLVAAHLAAAYSDHPAYDPAWRP